LVISKNIVEMMNGDIWVESELGDGAIVSFTVNLGCNRTGNKKALAQGTNAGDVRLLIIDNDVGTRVFFEEITINLGITCDITQNSEDALKMIAENEKYTICFIASELTEITGIKLAEAIGKTSPDSKIVLMASAAEWGENKEQALEAGIVTYITKPLFASPVTDCINELLYSDELSIKTTDNHEADFTGFTVLLVEDVEINREIVLALLEPTHLKIECAENGIEAVEAFKNNPYKYDMVFMDIQMPEMDGFTATRLIRASGLERSKTIPIVAMTANAFQEDIDKCLESGMNGHLGKPLVFDMVISTLEDYLHGK